MTEGHRRPAALPPPCSPAPASGGAAAPARQRAEGCRPRAGDGNRDSGSTALRGPLPLPFPKGTAETGGTPRGCGRGEAGKQRLPQAAGPPPAPPHASAPGAAPSPTMCSPGSEWSWYPDRWSPPAAPAPSGPTRPSAPLSRPPGPLKRSLGERVTAALTLPGQLPASGAWLPGEAGGGRAGRGALPRALSARSQSALGARRGRRGGGRGRGAQEVGQRRGGAG